MVVNPTSFHFELVVVARFLLLLLLLGDNKMVESTEHPVFHDHWEVDYCKMMRCLVVFHDHMEADCKVVVRCLAFHVGWLVYHMVMMSAVYHLSCHNLVIYYRTKWMGLLVTIVVVAADCTKWMGGLLATVVAAADCTMMVGVRVDRTAMMHVASTVDICKFVCKKEVNITNLLLI